jgi:hypothetical protein
MSVVLVHESHGIEYLFLVSHCVEVLEVHLCDDVQGHFEVSPIIGWRALLCVFDLQVAKRRLVREQLVPAGCTLVGSSVAAFAAFALILVSVFDDLLELLLSEHVVGLLDIFHLPEVLFIVHEHLIVLLFLSLVSDLLHHLLHIAEGDLLVPHLVLAGRVVFGDPLVLASYVESQVESFDLLPVLIQVVEVYEGV